MKPFQGFPRIMDFTPIPNLFLNKLMPHINNIAELKITLYIFMSIYKKKGYPRFVTFNELLNNVSLVKSLKKNGETPEDTLFNALNLATKRGVILHLSVDNNNRIDDIYFLNTQSDAQAIQRLTSVDLNLVGSETKKVSTTLAKELPDIFTYYEENIGILTPIIADELKEAEKIYPNEWICDAIKQSVVQNKRKWNYISAILERWSAEGKNDGAYRRDTQKEDPDKYIKGKYGHMVRRR
jgi:DnaD/phage-associated family protein